jgi:hypothetical protein
MSFETFKRQRTPVSREPFITLQKQGAISFNTAAYEALHSPKHVELLYDREARLIGLQKAAPTVAHAYPVRPLGKSGTTHVVSGKAFLTYYGIEIDVARRWKAELRDGMLVIDLKQRGTDVSGHRRRAMPGGG